MSHLDLSLDLEALDNHIERVDSEVRDCGTDGAGEGLDQSWDSILSQSVLVWAEAFAVFVPMSECVEIVTFMTEDGMSIVVLIMRTRKILVFFLSFFLS